MLVFFYELLFDVICCFQNFWNFIMTKTKFNKDRIRFYLKIALVFLLLNLFGDLVRSPETFLKQAINEVWQLFYLFFVIFLLFEYTIPFLKLTWKRILVTPFLFFGYLFLFTLGFYAWILIGKGMNIYSSLKTFKSTQDALSNYFPKSVGAVFFFGILKHYFTYQNLKEIAQKLRIEKQEAELNYLKSQTNPHFLFNTLNNIYSLARDKSDLAPESILRLSKILRFMLYETGGEYIAIEDELKIIDDYIALEKLRYDDTLNINFNYDIEDMKQALPPLLLIPLVENAFKHGVSETRNQPFIDIHLSVNQRLLKFVVRNSTETNLIEMKENIGLSNLRRQLELLYSDHDLSVQQSESVFDATLNINLASHA